MEGETAFAIVVERGTEIDRGRHHAVRVEPHVRPKSLLQGSAEEHRHQKERDRQGHLAAHEEAADPVFCARRRGGAGLQSGYELVARAVERRQETTEEARA
jgi:hypothetical protein